MSEQTRMYRIVATTSIMAVALVAAIISVL